MPRPGDKRRLRMKAERQAARASRWLKRQGSAETPSTTQ